MKKEIRANYIQSFPQSKRLLNKVGQLERTDKGQAAYLIKSVESLGAEYLLKIEKELLKSIDKDSNLAIQFLYDTLSQKFKDFRLSVQEYLRCSEMSSCDSACKKYEQRSRAEHEDIAVKFYVYLLYIKGVMRDKSYIKFYDENLGKIDLRPLDKEGAIPKKLFDIDMDSIRDEIDEPHLWTIKENTKYTARGLKRYITQQKNNDLTLEEKRWMLEKYYVAHVDLSNASLHTVYLTWLKAKQFRDYWGFDEVEENYYHFDIGYSDLVDKDNLPEEILFHTYAGINNEFVVFSYRDVVSDRYRIISLSTLKEIYRDFDSILNNIKSLYVSGSIDINGNITSINIDESVFIPRDNSICYDEVITFMGIPYTNSIPYLHTYIELEQAYEEEQKELEKEQKKKSEIAKIMRDINYGYGIPYRELEGLYYNYMNYLDLVSQGRLKGVSQNMTFRRYFLWAERGYALYERSHQSTVPKVVSPPVEDSFKVDRDALREKYNSYI